MFHSKPTESPWPECEVHMCKYVSMYMGMYIFEASWVIPVYGQSWKPWAYSGEERLKGKGKIGVRETR